MVVKGGNTFTLKRRSAILAGKPEPVSRQNDGVKIIDVNAGHPKTPGQVQVMPYLSLLPTARPQCQGCVMAGQAVTATIWLTSLPTRPAATSSTPQARRCNLVGRRKRR